MNEHELANTLLDLFPASRKRIISPIRGIVVRGGGFAIVPPEDLEAGDMIIVPPSLVTQEAPTRGYIQGCIEKCWPQIQELIQ